MTLAEYVARQQARVDHALQRWVPPESTLPESIHKAMRYSLFAGGKRIRPLLCMAAAEAVSDSPVGIESCACTLELIHTYSLIHDDLPALDNDDLRRGVPTCHKVFGDAMAILTGDAHYGQMARILLYDTRQLVDYDGAWHYGQPGLLTEATTLAAPRGRGVSAWLPWCTAAILDPMVQFQDVFDSMDLDKIGNLPLDVRRSKLAAYALHHGFPSIGLPASR